MIIVYQNYIAMSNLEIFIAIIFLGCISTSANVSGGKANEWKYGCYDSTAYKGDNTSSPSELVVILSLVPIVWTFCSKPNIV